MGFQIPEHRVASLAKLVKLSSEERQNLERAFGNVQPTLDQGDLVRRVASDSGIAAEDVREFARLLTELEFLRERRRQGSLTDFVTEISEAANQSDEESLRLEGATRAQFEEFLARLLELESVWIGAKGIDVMLEQQHAYCDARVLSDLRPIFGHDPSRPPSAMVVVHKLRLAFHENKKYPETKEFYLALDSSDVRELKSILERAIEKEAALAEMSKESGLLCLRAEGSSHAR